MSFVKKYLNFAAGLLQNPAEGWLQAISRVQPDWAFRRYNRLTRQQGIDRLYLILSFDCDTPEDIPAVEQMHIRLRELGIKETYAVPGQILELGAETFRRLADDGAQFINHGALPHAEERDGRYWSITFYNEMTPAEVRADIFRGHEIVEQITGCTPIGFRAPHFGLLQGPEDLAIMHSACRELGYCFSTSSVPIAAFLHGAAWRVNNMLEIPVSGSSTLPLTILDSWSHIISPQQPFVQASYGTLFTQTVDFLLAHDVAGVLNYYVDPSHISRSGIFFDAVVYTVKRGVSSLHYTELLDLLG
jgi:hypothetical protein